MLLVKGRSQIIGHLIGDIAELLFGVLCAFFQVF